MLYIKGSHAYLINSEEEEEILSDDIPLPDLTWDPWIPFISGIPIADD